MMIVNEPLSPAYSCYASPHGRAAYSMLLVTCFVQVIIFKMNASGVYHDQFPKR